MKDTPLEKVLAFNTIINFLPKKEINKLRKLLSMTDDDVERNWGKDIESQFYFILFFRENIEYILPFDEQFPKLSETPSPDVLIVFKDGRKILVEIKGSKSNKKKLSKSRIKRQIDFADKMHMPLYYLFRLDYYWGLFEADYIYKENRNLKFPEDLRKSKFESLFGIKKILFKRGIVISSIHSKTKRPSPKIRHVDGNLVAIKLCYEETVLEIKLSHSSFNLIRFLTCLFSALTEVNSSEIKSEEISKYEKRIFRNYVLKKNIVLDDFYFILTIVYSTVNAKNKLKYDTTSFISYLLQNNSNRTKMLTYRDFIDDPIDYLFESGIPITKMQN
jgi:Holliday junction resolvase